MDDLNDLTPQKWVVDDEAWEWLTEMLDEPPKDIPGLRKLMGRPSIWAASRERMGILPPPRLENPKFRRERIAFYITIMIYCVTTLTGVVIQNWPLTVVGLGMCIFICLPWALHLDGMWGKWSRTP